VVKPDSPIRSFPDFAQRIKDEPGKYTYTSVGVGTAMHLVGEWLMAESGGSATHVPFRGGTAPLTELLAGRVDVVIDTMTSTAPMLKDKRVRGLAVTGAKGEANIFGLPNVAETYPRLVFDSWLGIAAPAGLPPAIAARLQREIKAVIDSPEVRQRLIDWGGNPHDIYYDDRLFAAGDSAHRFPPTGGMGLNSGVQDVHNLVWKLAAVAQGTAADSLLDTYEEERRPVARRNAELIVVRGQLRACQKKAGQ
jgi:2-polyprenyl-6-methoxyphenol hydroxylase-like FAD-dependent oxidoreductase